MSSAAIARFDLVHLARLFDEPFGNGSPLAELHALPVWTMDRGTD